MQVTESSIKGALYGNGQAPKRQGQTLLFSVEISYPAEACRDAPVHASSLSGFERVIMCGHVSGLLCGPSTTARRYGATRTWCKSVLRARGSLAPNAFPDPLSPIFVFTVRWPPRTPAIRPALPQHLRNRRQNGTIVIFVPIGALKPDLCPSSNCDKLRLECAVWKPVYSSP